MSKKKVLLIEDTKSIKEEVAFILQMEDYEVIEAFDGLQGLELAQQQLPDLIISDVLMPRLDGLNLKLELLKEPKTACIPFIIFSAKVSKDDINTAKALGINDYITKPLDIDIFIHKIKKYIQ